MDSINETLIGLEAQSPFLPDTHIQFAWDSTSLGMFKTCPRLYYFTMIEGWTPKDENVHLRFGQEYHWALEAYQKERVLGIKHNDAVHDVVRELLIRTMDYDPSPDTKAGKYKSRNNLIGLVIANCDKFEDDPATIHVLANGKPATELSFRFELGFGPEVCGWIPDPETKAAILDDGGTPNQPYLLCGHLDRVVDFNGQLMVLDHKTTTSTLSGQYFKQWEPNNQMTLYTIAGQVVLNTPIKGIIIEAAQIMLEDSHRFVRGVTYRTPDQLEEWLKDLELTLRTAEVYATEGYWPMNDTSCDKFGGCRFREVCSKSPSVRKQFLRSDFNQLPIEDRWNPLKPR